MISGVSAKDSVISVRIEVLFEIFVSLNQCFCVFVSILNMNVVIGDAMANQQFPTQFSGTLYWVNSISSCILLWGAHVSLCINRIVVAPIGGRSY